MYSPSLEEDKVLYEMLVIMVYVLFLYHKKYWRSTDSLQWRIFTMFSLWRCLDNLALLIVLVHFHASTAASNISRCKVAIIVILSTRFSFRPTDSLYVYYEIKSLLTCCFIRESELLFSDVASTWRNSAVALPTSKARRTTTRFGAPLNRTSQSMRALATISVVSTQPRQTTCSREPWCVL